MTTYSPERVAATTHARWGDADSAARFWTHVTKTATCWVWSGSRDRKGYGRVNVGGHYWLAHRFAWWLATGEDPAGPLLHECDNPPCVRPEHLRPGTAQENNADALARGRVARGEAAGPSRLTDAEVRQIRALYRPGTYGYVRLGRAFGVSWGAVRSIVTGRTWRHLL